LRGLRSSLFLFFLIPSSLFAVFTIIAVSASVSANANVLEAPAYTITDDFDCVFDTGEVDRSKNSLATALTLPIYPAFDSTATDKTVNGNSYQSTSTSVGHIYDLVTVRDIATLNLYTFPGKPQYFIIDDLHLEDNAKLILSPGTYYIKNIVMDGNIQISLDTNHDGDGSGTVKLFLYNGFQPQSGNIFFNCN
jgi:hypothetical protein